MKDESIDMRKDVLEESTKCEHTLPELFKVHVLHGDDPSESSYYPGLKMLLTNVNMVYYKFCSSATSALFAMYK